MGQKVTLQNPKTLAWDIPAKITGIRVAPDNKILSYNLLQDNGTQTTRHRTYIRATLPDDNVDGEVEGADQSLVQPDDAAVDEPADIHGTIHDPVMPVSSRLRSRARVATLVEWPESQCDELVETKDFDEVAEKSSLAPSLNKNAAVSHSVTILDSLVKYHSAWCCAMPGQSSCTCKCALALYAGFSTILWLGLASMLAHTSHTAISCNDIQGTKGNVEIINEESVSVDFFNSHHEEISEKGEEKSENEDPCSQSCFHYFTKMEIGEIISFVLLGYLIVANWTKISLWLHRKWIGIKKAAAERESAALAAKREEEERRIRAEIELELARVAVVPSDQGQGNQAPAIPVDLN